MITNDEKQEILKRNPAIKELADMICEYTKNLIPFAVNKKIVLYKSVKMKCYHREDQDI